LLAGRQLDAPADFAPLAGILVSRSARRGEAGEL